MTFFRKKTVKKKPDYDACREDMLLRFSTQCPDLFPEHKTLPKPKPKVYFSRSRELNKPPLNSFSTKAEEDASSGKQPLTEEKKAIDSLKARGMSDEEIIARRFRKESTFVETVRRIIIAKNMKNSHVYHAIHMDRRLFSKIMADNEYKPARDTVLTLCIGLEATKSEAVSLLAKCGYAFNYEARRDIIILYFIEDCRYDIDLVNEMLYRFGEQPLGY